MHFYRKCWFDPFDEQFISPFLSDCPFLMLGIAIHWIQHSQALLERRVCELAHSFFHFNILCHGEYLGVKTIDKSCRCLLNMYNFWFPSDFHLLVCCSLLSTLLCLLPSAIHLLCFPTIRNFRISLVSTKHLHVLGYLYRIFFQIDFF